MIGQELYPYSHDAKVQSGEGIEDKRHLFPQTKISYTYALKSGIRLEVIGIGEPLKISRFIKAYENFYKKDSKGIRWYIGPEDGKFYDGSMEDMLKKYSLSTTENGHST